MPSPRENAGCISLFLVPSRLEEHAQGCRLLSPVIKSNRTSVSPRSFPKPISMVLDQPFLFTAAHNPQPPDPYCMKTRPKLHDVVYIMAESTRCVAKKKRRPILEKKGYGAGNPTQPSRCPSRCPVNPNQIPPKETHPNSGQRQTQARKIAVIILYGNTLRRRPSTKIARVQSRLTATRFTSPSSWRISC